MGSSSSRKNLEQFLAAPDSVRRSDVEKHKLLVRKAKLEAEEVQLRRSKSTKRPTTEDLLADIIRVAEDVETNPHAKFKTVSRKRYRLFGHYPVEFVDEQFGQFEHAKQVAGLEDRPGDRRKKAAIAEKSRRQHAVRYMRRFILPHVRKCPELEREMDGVKLVLSISDTHATFLDPFVWHAFLSTARDLRPDIVYFNGDILEGSEISRYPKIPGWTVPLQMEFDFAREMFRQTRSVVPKETQIVWGAGNHGLDRIASYLTQVAPAFAKLDGMRFDKLANLEGLDVELAQGGTIASPKGTESEPAGRLLYGFYRVHHGTHLGEHPATQELRSAGRSGQSGHVHRAMLVHGGSEGNRMHSWMCTPMGCNEIAGRAYMKGIHTGWQKGFGLAFLKKGGHVRQYPVLCEDGVAIVEGYVYERPKDMMNPDPQELWLTKLAVPQ